MSADALEGAQVVQRMDLARLSGRGAHVGAVERAARQQRRLRILLLEVSMMASDWI